MPYAHWYENVQRGLTYTMVNGVGLFTAPVLQPYPLAYAITSRVGGVTRSVCGTLNLSCKRKDTPENVRQNYKLAAAAAGINPDTLTCTHYVHGDSICIVTPRDAGAGVWRENHLPACDAIATEHKGLALVSLHADCVPAAIYDTAAHAACLCHAGWRGTSALSVTKAFQTMASAFGSRAKDCIGVVGPCICAACYEVDAPVAEAFSAYDARVLYRRGEKYHVDLALCTAEQFRRLGFPPQNVCMSGLCTKCDPRLYSYRRDGEDTGAFAQLLELK